MRGRLTTWLDVSLTVVVFMAFVPLLLLGSLVLAGKWAFDASRAMAKAALSVRP